MSTRVGEIFAELELDTSNFEKSIRESERRFTNLRQTADQALRNVRQSGQHASTGLDSVSDSADSARRAAQNIALPNNLQREAEQAATRLGNVQREARGAATATRNIDMNGSLVRELQRAQQELAGLQNNARGAGEGIGEGLGGGISDRMGGALERVGGIAEGAGGSAGAGFLGSFGGRVASLGTKAGPIGMALAGVAAIGLVAGAALADAIADGMKQEKHLDLIQAQLEINPETTRRIGEASGLSFSDGWGESVEANMDGVKAAIQAGLLTGEEDTSVIKSTVDQLNIVAGIMGEDIPAVARAAGKSVQNGIAADATGAFDLLVKSQKNSLNVSEDLLDSQVEYSTQLRALGLEGQEGWALVSQGVKGGARDTDVVIDALKEFKLRATDGTAAAADGFDKLGLNAESWGAAMNEGGVASRNAMADALRGLNAIKDPTDKNAAALALFGTKFEDIQGAAFALNLDTAVQQFGNVEGATKKAGDTMSQGTAASFEAAQNSITVSADKIKLALADAFGPHLKDLADWVKAHQPEIIGFFTGLATGALSCLDGMMAFSSGALRAWAFFADGVGGSMASVVSTMAVGVDAAASLADALGFDDKAASLRGVADGMRGFAEMTETAGDKARGMADVIDAGRPIIQGMRDDVGAAGQAAQNSELMMRALGEGVNAVPDGKNINITDSTPEAQQRLRDLGLTVTTLPDGTVDVSANTAEGQAIIDAWIHQPRNVDVAVRVSALAAAENEASRLAAATTNEALEKSGGYVHYAAGGIEDHNAQIGNGRTRIWNEPETGGEAYIPLTPSKRGRSVSILADVADRFGMSLMQFADGGVVEGMSEWVGHVSPGMQMTSGYRDSADHHGSGLAADFSNGSGNTDEMLALANAIADRYPDSLELIYSDPRFTRNIKDGQIVDPSYYGADTMAEHQNHVHWARKQAPSLADSDTDFQAPAVPDNRTEKQKIADAIVAEGKRRGVSDKGIKTALATGLAESDLQNLDHGDRDSTGVFQQRDNGAWGTAEDRMDPTRSAGMFYDQLQKLDYENMSEAEAAQAVQKSAFSDGSNYAAKLSEADALLAESYARSAATSPAPGSDGKTAQSGTGQAVYVTNWPSSFSSGTSSTSSSGTSAPAAPAPKTEPNTESHDVSTPAGRRSLDAAIRAKFFANGGLEDHTAQIANAGDMRVWAEPETGGEAYIPLGSNKRDRSVALLKQVARQFGYALNAYADGGFGGVGGANDHTAGSWRAITAAGNSPSSLATPLRDTRLLKARDQAQQLAGFAAGAALAVVSGFDGDGNFTGNFNTSNTSIPGLDKALEQLAAIAAKPTVHIDNAEVHADNPEQLVDEVMDPSRLPFMQTGI
ncbi:hypothetical protein JOJ86_006034 [Rhodococcus percolatus]|uniref:phage tail tape measure protein n=1 Tax=Rhodococcus opacus TaxID=37919 RepID=UPI0015F9C4C6|nr:phage tail tape measure protein [Rhodococcus opacus]MBA8964756.1 hypothetical protein [Rhodococcus opacus]MBP2208308.1 hypothetical protein [Rhodococcus opacus]